MRRKSLWRAASSQSDFVLLVVVFVVFVAFVLPEMADAACTGKAIGVRDNVNLCFSYTTEFVDEGVGEDLWTSDADAKTARGVRIKILRSDGTTAYGGTDGAYTDPATGCTGLITIAGVGLQGLGPFTVRAYSQAQIAGASSVNTVDVRRYSDNNRFFIDLATNYNPTDNSTCSFTWPNSSSVVIADTGGTYHSGDIVNLAAAVGFSIDQVPGDLSSKTIKVFNQGCPSSSGQCPGPTNGNCTCEDSSSAARIFMSDDGSGGTPGTQRKFAISHETGHAISILNNGGLRADTDPTPAAYPDYPDACARTYVDAEDPSHKLVSREWQGTAAYEGLADFYSSAVWNNQSNANCVIKYWKDDIDMDQDGDLDSYPVVGCMSNLSALDYPDADYMHVMCDSPHSARSTELDWMRVWSNLHYQGVPTGEIMEIWDGANSDTWNPQQQHGFLDSPYDRIVISADAQLGSTDFGIFEGLVDEHGVNE